ncbi:MAG: hypothetical protein GY870_00980 [archaeon]|nr:hypothetical protein [archaeon]
MFENIEAEIKSKKAKMDTSCIKKDMQESLPQIYNALYPTATSLATETRIQIINTRENLQKWVEKNSNLINLQRSLFQSFLDRFRSIQQKLGQIS